MTFNPVTFILNTFHKGKFRNNSIEISTCDFIAFIFFGERSVSLHSPGCWNVFYMTLSWKESLLPLPSEHWDYTPGPPGLTAVLKFLWPEQREQWHRAMPKLMQNQMQMLLRLMWLLDFSLTPSIVVCCSKKGYVPRNKWLSSSFVVRSGVLLKSKITKLSLQNVVLWDHCHLCVPLTKTTLCSLWLQLPISTVQRYHAFNSLECINKSRNQKMQSSAEL